MINTRRKKNKFPIWLLFYRRTLNMTSENMAKTAGDGRHEPTLQILMAAIWPYFILLRPVRRVAAAPKEIRQLLRQKDATFSFGGAVEKRQVPREKFELP